MTGDAIDHVIAAKDAAVLYFQDPDVPNIGYQIVDVFIDTSQTYMCVYKTGHRRKDPLRFPSRGFKPDFREIDLSIVS